MNKLITLLAFCLGCSSLSFVGCSTLSNLFGPEQVEMGAVEYRNPPAPEGVIRYCWEEPMVDYQRVEPGLDNEGRWYRPAHIAVREVKMGRWRPCKSVDSDTYSSHKDKQDGR